jgi:GNAT superfamily N-acetyltransferase
MQIEIRPIELQDQPAVTVMMIEHWGSKEVVAHDTVYLPHELPGFIAWEGDRVVGLLTYHIDGLACEIVTINSLVFEKGIGTALIESVKKQALQAGCSRLWLITTNDNLNALKFYQKRGFVLVALRRDVMVRARQIKPQIPLTGDDGIPIRDEIELELALA